MNKFYKHSQNIILKINKNLIIFTFLNLIIFDNYIFSQENNNKEKNNITINKNNNNELSKNETKKLDLSKRPEIDKNELRSKPVLFQNISSTPATSNMKEEDLKLGEKLVEQSRNKEVINFKRDSNIKPISQIPDTKNEKISKVNLNQNTNIQNENLQNDILIDGFIVKRVYDEAKPGLGADLILITNKTNIGHINRLQRVLAAYIAKNFDYDLNDAKTTSRFVLYYNANNRGNLKLVKKHYSQDVASVLDPKKIGIDKSYKNWAGKTELIIPLRKNLVSDTGKDLNIKELQKVGKVSGNEKKEIRETEKKLIKKEVAKLEDKKENLDKQINDSKNKIKQLKENNENLEKEKANKATNLKELKKDPIKNKDEIKKEESKVEEISKKQEKVNIEQKKETQKQNELKEQKRAVVNQKGEAISREKEISNQEKNKTASLSKASEQNKIIEKLKEENKNLKEGGALEKNIVQDKILFMKVLKFTKQGHYQNELWYIDSNKDDTVIRSPYTNICSKDFSILKNVGVVLTGYKGNIDSQTDHSLILLGLDKLEFKKSSSSNVYWRTPIIVRDEKIYAFEEDNGVFYLTRFNTDLEAEVRSRDKVDPNSEITFYKDKIYLTGKSSNNEGNIIFVLKNSDLSILKIIDSNKLNK